MRLKHFLIQKKIKLEIKDTYFNVMYIYNFEYYLFIPNFLIILWVLSLVNCNTPIQIIIF